MMCDHCHTAEPIRRIYLANIFHGDVCGACAYELSN